jgi:ATP-dependent Clp protease ATP-binding subunit ClpC
MLLQIMEEGHLTDAKGRMVDFRNAIIVMTTNVGAEEIRKQTSLGFQLKRDEKTEERTSYEEMRKKLTESLKKVFRPEFINRLDSVIVFRSLSKDDIRQIVALELNKVTERLAEHVVTLTATDSALDLLATQGFDPEMGARPLRRVIQQKVEDPLSDALLAGTFNEGDTILVEVVEENVVLKRMEEPEKTPEPIA